MKKIISFVSLLGLLLNSFATPLSVIAQEATSSPTPETIISTEVATSPSDLPVIDLATLPEETPTPVEESIPTPTDQVVVENVSSTETEPQVAEPSATLTTPEPQPVEKVYLSDGQIVIDTSNSEWNVEGNTAETKEPVRLGVKYVFPLETGVTLTFKSLPANESLHTTIKITKVKVSDLNFPDDMKPYGEYAYDITTGMVDGTFDYDLTLPKPNDQNVDVAYMEDKNSTPTALADNQTTQDGGTVRASNIDHFTIFVVINPAPTGPSCVLAGATTETGCYSTIQAAIDASVNGDVIEIQSDITVGQRVNVNKDVTINGNGFTVNPTFTKTDNSNNAVFGITSSGVTISNLVIDGALGTNLHGINVYVSTGVLLDGVSVLNNGYAGMVVNGSIVTVNNIVTSGNGWGGINVDQGSGVTSEARLTVNGLSSHTEAVHIWIDDSRKNVSVVDTLDQYDITNSGHARIYTLNTSTSGNPSATLSQYANDAPTGWVNGNLGASKATYYEGNSIPYRMVMDNLSLASHSLTIEWDTTKSSKHAEDYLTSFDRTVSTADPCIGVSGCSTFSTFPIPVDPQVSGAGVTPVAGNFTLYGGTITGVSAYSYADGTGFVGDKSARITITFTPSVSNPVLAWGGHIADRKDWGANNSAISIPGSPYHMRLIDLDGYGGNQDRSLSADAVIFPASITIIKAANPEDSTSFPFTASPSPLTNFSLVDDGTAANISTFSGITNFQTYTVTENTPSGWSLDGVVCSVTSPNGGSQNVNGATATIDITEGENVTCTYTNSLQQANLTLVKTVTKDNGGTALETAWTLSAAGPTPISGATGDTAITSAPVNAGTYTLSESGGPVGYTAGSWSCVKNGGNPATGSSITLDPGDDATCTINNDDIAPSLTLTKIVSSTHGGTAATTDWTLTATGLTSISGAGGATSDGTFKAGTYTLSESTGPTGYTAGTWSCTGATVTNGNQITLALNQTASCSITNSDIAPILHLRKTLITDNGGAATTSSFTLTANGTGLNDLTGTSPVDSGTGLLADTFALSESGPSGYSQSDWVCVGGSQNGSNITLGLGQEATCTITNDDIAPSLILNKILSLTHGGNEAESDWTLTADGGTAGTLSGPGAAGGTDVISGSNFQAGTYTLSELGPTTGYNTSSWRCTGTGSLVENQITLGVGQSAICSITNSDVTPTVTLNKLVDINYGGTATPSSFTLTLGGSSVIQGVENQVLANHTYAINELSLAGYSFSYITGDAICPVVLGGTVTLDEGQKITCTITNHDLPATLIVIKHVINDNGGGKTAGDFKINVTGTDVSTPSFNGQESPGTTVTLDAGTYSVDETSVQGYTKTFQGDCGGTIANGQTKTWTITNNDQPGQIKIIKEAVGGNGTFGFDITGPSTSSPNVTTSGNIGDTGFISVDAGNYSISEDAKTGWKLTGSSCDFGTPEQFSVSNGGTVTCTFTNTKYGFMQGRKYLDNNLNGRLDLAESGTFQNNWTIRLYDSNWQPKETQLTRILMDPSGGQYRFENLLPGTYYACEVLPVGWQQMGPVLGSHAVNYDNIQVNGSIAVINGSGVPGEGPVCWQSNINGDEFGWLGFGNIQKGHIIVDKVTDPSEDVQSFSFDATGNGYADFTLTDQDPPNDQELLPGIYTISEADVNGWELESASCISSIKDSESVSRLDLDPGETITCTFNNLKLDPKISITKSNNLSGGITAGTTVTYTINIKNDGNVYIYDIDITDILPGGFTYVLGSTTGAITSDPVVAGGKLTWENVGDLGVGEFLTISYQAKTGMDISNGTYINIASCGAKYGKRPETGPYLTDFQENIISCRTVSSAVTVGSTQGYGGNLAGQVLGISTELPATGNPTWVLIAAFAALGAGIYLNVYAKKKTKNVKK